MSHSPERLAEIRSAVSGLAGADFAKAGRKLLDAMGYRSPKTLDAPAAPGEFLVALGMDTARFDTLSRWRAVHFLFQLTGDELPALSRGGDPATGGSFQRGAIDSFVFLAIDLDDGGWSRRQLVAIVRALNRGFAMPAIVLFRHGGQATLTVIDRRANRRDASRDVVGGRISLIKDIDLARPHRAHVEILADLSLAALARRKAPSDFRALYDLWLETLSAAELNKRFYQELADWFAWASTSAPITFPKGQGDGDGAKEIALIRLLTRLMFVWFIKEKRLVPEALFDANALARLLKEPPGASPVGHGYYLAILQNLFFATLNTEMPDRRWREDEGGQSKDYLGHHVYRHAALFAEPDKALEAFASVPFLNGGLFECLDTEIASDDSRADHAGQERGRLILRIDGFSDQPDKQPRLPNALFFGGAKGVDLSGWFEKAKAPRNVPGLIDLFERYKFTVEENTPLEEEAALDPELLGKVFENLLASYNEDTKTTARNKSGSFYTPREVVDFMVDEALVAWLLPKLPSELDLNAARPRAQGLDFGTMPGELDLGSPPRTPSAGPTGKDEARLRALLSFASRSHEFSSAQVDALIASIESCKAIDPAVGSGAFPLGLLQKLVHVLDVLDPGGEKWRARNRLYYERRLAEAKVIPAANERAAEIETAEAALIEFDAKFESGHYPDYTRKLFLIDRCLHGVDIQPIAVQIAKLRCFISLAVEQNENPNRLNRGITPLPNLEAKFVAANTLTPLHRELQGWLPTQDLKTKQQALREANRAFFAAANGAAKRAVQKRIKKLREEIAGEVSREHTFAGEDAKKLAAWDPFDPNAFAPFFDGEWMFGVDASAEEGWFDIAFANPPYIRQEKIESFRVNDKPVIAKAQLKADYKTFAGTADIYVYFYERALRLLKPQGALAFITSNKWYRAGYGKGLREWLSTNARILKIVDFGDAPVFEAIAYPTILVGTRKAVPSKPGTNETVQSLNWTPIEGEDPKESVKRFPERFAAEAFAMPQAELSPGGWQLEPQAERDLLARLRRGGVPLGEWCNGRFYRGILTGLNEAFVIDGAKRDELIAADPASAEIIKPFLRGRDVKRWQTEPEDLWLIKIESSTNKQHPWTGLPERKAEAEFAKTRPAIYRWFSEHRQGLTKRYDKGRYFWELRACDYWDAFEEPKIIVPAIVGRSEAAPDIENHYCNNKATIFIAPNVPYTLGLMNSAVSDWFARQTFSSKQGGFLDYEPRYSGTIPIPKASKEDQAVVAVAVDAIVAGTDRPRLEALINAFVYELFFADELHARNVRPFAAARDAGLMNLADLEGPALARAAENWSHCLADPAHPLYATLFELQSIDAVRIIEGRG
ncbi:Eco57I restriction-modification methylase domain-containing protein [Mesorhizobium sp. BR-1-1-8]|uniref:Eco57I restriction-modification methylase domain-containing protein n=1 Tax=Mesorhizobium sp. BR-1-1-8 TaxID=2876659 RepID=UPI001CCA9AD2|nr:Eco57I restriction-modification methylase domain-containing protein [Mesorhizobium sp. BR-1-1-8]MBZ9983982.1 Eco57I restriction-modification methylase domain-containing protein [Mesorhizobium sp. BR-1-1-8]